MSIKLQINVDNQTVTFSGNKLTLKISAKANNGLSLANGKIIATKAPDGESGSGGTMNTAGNALGPLDATSSTSLPRVGFNSTVARKKKYAPPVGAYEDPWIKNNDGPVMAKFVSGTLSNCIAAHMITYAGGQNE